MDVDGSGNIYVADQGNNAIRKITSNGVVTTLAGNGSSGFVNATGSSATFSSPRGVSPDRFGNIYVADWQNYVIRKITSNGVVTTLAGSGVSGTADGIGTNASFGGVDSGGVMCLAVDGSGNVFAADDSRIRKVTSNGVVTTITLSESIYPAGVALDAMGNLYTAGWSQNKIYKITTNGAVTTLAGNGRAGFVDGMGTNASFRNPSDVAVDGSGNVYVADQGNNAIRMITSNGVVTTLAGGGFGGIVDGNATVAKFSAPTGIAIDSTGNIYVAAYLNNSIRKLSPQYGAGGYVAPNVIMFPNLTNQTYSNGLSIGLSATASSGLAVSYSSSSTNISIDISIVGTNVTVLGAGTASIVASQAGNSNYVAATPVTNTLIITKASNTITFPALSELTYSNGLTIGLGGTASSGLAVSYSSASTNVSISGTNVSILGAGTASIVASQTGNSNYLAATRKTNTLVIAKGSNVINFPSLSTRTYEQGAFGIDLGGTASSGLAVSYSCLDWNVVIWRNIATIYSVGTYSIVATQGGDSNYLAASPVTNTLIITKSTRNFTFASNSLSQTYTGSNAVASLTNAGPLVSYIITYNGSTNLPTNAGTYTVVATVSDTNNYTAYSVTNTLTIAKAGNTITFPSLSGVTYSNGLTVGLGATASSGLALSYSSASTNVSISGTNVTILGAGTTSIVASQSGNSNYVAATPVTNSLEIINFAIPVKVPVIYLEGSTQIRVK